MKHEVTPYVAVMRRSATTFSDADAATFSDADATTFSDTDATTFSDADAMTSIQPQADGAHPARIP
jgi:hypothetical protein